MTRYVTIRLTVAQAQAASNACDLIRDQLEADGQRREAALYRRASEMMSQTNQARRPERLHALQRKGLFGSNGKTGGALTPAGCAERVVPNIFDDLFDQERGPKR